MVNHQFYTIKFSSSRLKKYNYDVTMTFNEGKRTEEIVALADNQILRSIRDIRKIDFDKKIIDELYEERNSLKKGKLTKNKLKKINIIQERINHLLYIPDYITVVIDHKSHYEHIFKNGIKFNGSIYKRLSCSASQARVSTVVLCNTEIIDELKDRLNNGRNVNKKFSPSKFNAYFGLYGSSTSLVREPKFIVVPDFINYDRFKTNYVIETDWDKDDIIEEREIELEMNRTDGMGLISPNLAKLWAEDLELDYVPSQFCIRQSFIKGMVCVFDIHKFCEEKNNGNYIVNTIYKDENGNPIKADLRNYDLILSESQFKLWDSYNSIEEYINNYRKNKLYWGVTQFTPKKAKDALKLNYQFIQTLDLDKNDIKELSKQFVDWISGVSYDNIGYMLLFLLGVNNDERKINNFLRSSDNYWLKSLIINKELRNDKFIKNKIYNLIKKQIKNGCLGNIYVDGNFQVIVSDPYGFMQHVCGLEVTGLLKKDEFYSNYWNEKGVKVIDSMRSPMTYRSEHVILNLRKDEETEKWYRYCKLGIILNYHGHECVNYSGSDFDFDILATSSNKTMINGVYGNDMTVYYEPPKPEKINFTEYDLYKSDTFAFGSIIGSITNKSTSAYALLPIIENKFGKNSKEYNILESRLLQCCKAQSAQIDKTKIGREVKGIPNIWIEKQRIESEDTQEKIKEKWMYNEILLTKYPYFFKHLYKEANDKYKSYTEKYKKLCIRKLGINFETLMSLKNPNREQEDFIDGYYNYMPLIYSDSPMNLLCRHIENVDFEILNKIKISGENIYKIYRNNKISYTKDDYDLINNKFKEYIKSKEKETVNYYLNQNNNENSLKDDYFDIKNKMFDLKNNIDIIINCLIDYYYLENPNSSKEMLWKVYGENIYKNVKNNSNKKIKFPMPSENGNIVYMGGRYSWEEIMI